jgi:hypothetical protein
VAGLLAASVLGNHVMGGLPPQQQQEMTLVVMPVNQQQQQQQQMVMLSSMRPSGRHCSNVQQLARLLLPPLLLLPARAGVARSGAALSLTRWGTKRELLWMCRSLILRCCSSC